MTARRIFRISKSAIRPPFRRILRFPKKTEAIKGAGEILFQRVDISGPWQTENPLTIPPGSSLSLLVFPRSRLRFTAMEQGSLFATDDALRGELHVAIERLDFDVARRKLEEYRRLWQSSALTWEPELVAIGTRLARQKLNLDSGYDTWTGLAGSMTSLRVPETHVRVMQRHFFSRLLAANRNLFEELRTPTGRALGDFHLLADQPNNARRRYEKLVRQGEDTWDIRLRLGNCWFRLDQRGPARANYFLSFLAGLPDDAWSGIEDVDFLVRLRHADDPEWAFAELAAEGIARSRFSVRSDFEEFQSRFQNRFVHGARRFCFYWAVSENRAFCPQEEWLHARREMKALHPEYHSRYMRRLP